VKTMNGRKPCFAVNIFAAILAPHFAMEMPELPGRLLTGIFPPVK